ncbi:DNA polymerase/3'-5' exonuclease PolX [bacterium]|nr:DNA polymerase/3'-5' exonuclease PolX [bacterium]
MSTKPRLINALREMAILLELDGANTFKVGAYTKAVRALGDESLDIGSQVDAGTLTEIEGIGKGIAEKIQEFWDQGQIEELDDLKGKYPPGLVEMTKIPGFGAKKVRAVYQELGITTIEGLEKACEDGSVAGLKGFGKKSAEKIVAGIEQLRKHSGRFLLSQAYETAQPILEALVSLDVVEQVELAGSLRRWRETIKDVDFVCATNEPEAVMDFFVGLPSVERVTGKGTTKSSVLLDSGMGADLRCVSPEQYPFALQHFSGSKEHNTALRGRAKEMGLKSNEYGLFREGTETSLEAKTEADVYKHLGLAWIPPELREDMGEVEAAEEDDLPNLIVAEDVRGIMHLHTHYSDGRPEVEDYAKWAVENKIEWMGLADHSQTAAYAGGLKPADVERQFDEIDGVNEKYANKGVRLLKGIESDILREGALDYEDELLARFDYIVASVHSLFNLSEEDQTKRILCAIENPHTTILGHMTGRLLLARDGYEINQREIIKRCAQCKTIIEINANPHRLDLDWRLVHFAIEQGCLLSIGPDAHAMSGLDHMKYGIAMARKGWAEKQHIVNTWSMDEFLQFAAAKRKG